MSHGGPPGVAPHGAGLDVDAGEFGPAFLQGGHLLVRGVAVHHQGLAVRRPGLGLQLLPPTGQAREHLLEAVQRGHHGVPRRREQGHGVAGHVVGDDPTVAIEDRAPGGRKVEGPKAIGLGGEAVGVGPEHLDPEEAQPQHADEGEEHPVHDLGPPLPHQGMIHVHAAPPVSSQLPNTRTSTTPTTARYSDATTESTSMARWKGSRSSDDAMNHWIPSRMNFPAKR